MKAGEGIMGAQPTVPAGRVRESLVTVDLWPFSALSSAFSERHPGEVLFLFSKG